MFCLDADVGPTILESLGMESMTPEEMDLYSLEGKHNHCFLAKFNFW